MIVSFSLGLHSLATVLVVVVRLQLNLNTHGSNFTKPDSVHWLLQIIQVTVLHF